MRHRLHCIMQIEWHYVCILVRCADLGVTQNLEEVFNTHPLLEGACSKWLAEGVPATMRP